MMPDWLKVHIETASAQQVGFGRIAKPGICRKCGSKVLRGMDDYPIGKEATADPTILSSKGEALAILNGLETYWLYGSIPMTLELVYRDAYDIAHKPIGGVNIAGTAIQVVREHRCNLVFSGDMIL